MKTAFHLILNFVGDNGMNKDNKKPLSLVLLAAGCFGIISALIMDIMGADNTFRGELSWSYSFSGGIIYLSNAKVS